MNTCDPQRWEIALTFKTFLILTECPPRWKHYDLYLFRDVQVVFYVGQSFCAFARVWEHVRGGPKGHSVIGRFLFGNWPRSAHFHVELLDSHGPRFAALEHDLGKAERALIEEFRPCFNIALNGQPTPLPAGYLPPNAPIKHVRSFRRMLREAAYICRTEDHDETGW